MIFEYVPGRQIWHGRRKVKVQPRVIIWTNLVDIESQILYTKFSLKAVLVLEKILSHYENMPIKIHWKFNHQKHENFHINNSDIFLLKT